MEQLISAKASWNPVKDVWKVVGEKGEKIYNGRVLVVSHFLPTTISFEEVSNVPKTPPVFSRNLSQNQMDTSKNQDTEQQPQSQSQPQPQIDSQGFAIPFPPTSPDNSAEGERAKERSRLFKRRQSLLLNDGNTFKGSNYDDRMEIDKADPLKNSEILERFQKYSIADKKRTETIKPELKWHLRPSLNGNIGLSNAVNSVYDKLKVTYIGECEVEVPKQIQEEVTTSLLEHDCIPVFTTATEAHNHYNVFCKQTLWPIFHYALSYFTGVKPDSNSWKDYCTVNQKFADVIIQNYKPDDIIWINDYHLALVPQMVRKKLPDAMIGFFLHIPFPSSEIFRSLQHRNEILDGMLGADVVGFQTYSFARHFIHTCSKLIGVDTTPSSVILNDFVVYIGIFPIGIDFGVLQQKRQEKDVADYMETIKAKYPDQKILIGREKLDHIKGVPNKLLAFEMFLKKYPNWIGKVVLIQVVTHGSLGSYKDLQTQIVDIVSRINGKFGSLEYTPVVYLHQNIPQSQYLALLSIADGCIITSLRDGMNLTSHEYVGCQTERHSPLILSEFAGSYGSLAGAFRVNPWNYQEVVQCIYEALTISEEEKSYRYRELLRAVTTNSAQFWVESFIRQLVKITSVTHSSTTYLDIGDLVQNVRKTNNRLLIFGYDGTLTPIRRRPEQASPSPELLELLQRLACDPKNTVCVLTGRNRDLVDKWLGNIPNLYIGAENGCFVKKNGEDWVSLLDDSNFEWKDKLLEILEDFTDRTEGSEIEQKDASLTWHYRNTEQNFGAWQAKDLVLAMNKAIGDTIPINVIPGNKAIEIQPKNLNKVTTVKYILKQLPQQPEFMLCIGAEKYDEGLFEYLRGFEMAQETEDYKPMVATITIASKTSKAHSILENSSKVFELMNELTKM